MGNIKRVVDVKKWCVFCRKKGVAEEEVAVLCCRRRRAWSAAPSSQRTHALLDAAPVDDGARLENVELAAEALALLEEVDDGGLAEHDAVDGLDGGGDGAAEGVPVAAGAGRGGGAAAEGGAEGRGGEAGGDGLEAGGLHGGDCCLPRCVVDVCVVVDVKVWVRALPRRCDLQGLFWCFLPRMRASRCSSRRRPVILSKAVVVVTGEM
ncbi:hypothetical protein B0T11DRAFT_278240 [Plectosphaerella cucumerina]|uniref:Uncharacterized protein n=1 Tax=Plectosphaerella cucumerina TaxID=40658 RepID=A0A8K0TT16_9PEZI|nr:hypothetical protein B0T11DRAFT_278240 [Plectosphaerella cucumerina]